MINYFYKMSNSKEDADYNTGSKLNPNEDGNLSHTALLPNIEEKS